MSSYKKLLRQAKEKVSRPFVSDDPSERVCQIYKVEQSGNIAAIKVSEEPMPCWVNCFQDPTL